MSPGSDRLANEDRADLSREDLKAEVGRLRIALRRTGRLYACGNDMTSAMEGAYPGPGITLGSAITFGWWAGRGAAAAGRA